MALALHRRPKVQDISRSWILSKFEKFQAGNPKAPVRAWDRWDSWRRARTPEISEANPTAAMSVWHQLSMLRERLGLNMPLDDCKEYVMGKVQRNIVTPARVVQPASVVGVLVLLQQAAGGGRVLLQSICLALLSRVRWRHLQRSYFTVSDGTLLHAHCTQGKRRVQGVRPPYSWTVPILDSFSELFDQVAPRVQVGKQPFLVPALKRDASYAWSAAEIQDRPMGFRAFTEALRGVLVQLKRALTQRTSRLIRSGGSCRPWRIFGTWMLNRPKQ